MQFMRAILFLLIGTTITWHHPGNAYEFHIAGVDRATADLGERIHTNITHFKVCVRDKLWLIREQTEGFSVWLEAGTDGTNTYVLSFGIGPTGYIIPGSVPHTHTAGTIPVLWLAYASSAYLDEARDRTRLPVVDLRRGPNPYMLNETMGAQYERASESPSVLKRAAYFHSGKEPVWNDQEMSPWVVPPQMYPRPAPYDNGFTNSIYVATAFTNLGSLVLPTHAAYLRYWPAVGGTSSNDLRLVVRHEITVTNVESFVTIDSFKPAFKGKMPVADYRFAHAEEPVTGPIRYKTSDEWLSDAEVRGLPTFKSQSAENNLTYSRIAAAFDARPPK